MKLIINSPAKINFGLFITEKRSDGFHNIETVFYPLSLSDQIVMRECDHLLIETDKPELNIDPESNLMTRAVRLLQKETGKDLNCRITLSKNIPMGAGLGGGSSNAASVLLGLNDLFSLGYSKEELRKFGLRLGSDVPFFIHPYPAVGKGRGEILTEIEMELKGIIVVVNPGIHVATAAAYQACKPAKPAYDLTKLNGLKDINYNILRPDVKNDFEETVFPLFPVIGDLKRSFYDHGAEFSLMSGSGSTVFGIFNDNKKAEAFVSTLPREYLVHTEEL